MNNSQHVKDFQIIVQRNTYYKYTIRSVSINYKRSWIRYE